MSYSAQPINSAAQGFYPVFYKYKSLQEWGWTSPSEESTTPMQIENSASALMSFDFSKVTSLTSTDIAQWSKRFKDMHLSVKLSDFLNSCSNLTACDFSRTNLTDRHILVLSSNNLSLTKLNLTQCNSLIKPVLNFKGLKQLYINSCDKLEELTVGNDTLECLSAESNPKLKKVDLKMLNGNVVHLSSCPNLSQFSISSKNLQALFMNHCISLLKLDLSNAPEVVLLELKGCTILDNIELQEQGSKKLTQIEIIGCSKKVRQFFEKYKGRNENITVITKKR